MKSDFISRSALLEEVRKRILDKDEVKDDLDRQYNRGLLHAIKDVKHAPAVDAEPARRGEWIMIGAKRGRGGIFKCTNCDDLYPYKCNYCPRCGAKMDAKEAEK